MIVKGVLLRISRQTQVTGVLCWWDLNEKRRCNRARTILDYPVVLKEVEGISVSNEVTGIWRPSSWGKILFITAVSVLDLEKKLIEELIKEGEVVFLLVKLPVDGHLNLLEKISADCIVNYEGENEVYLSVLLEKVTDLLLQERSLVKGDVRGHNLLDF